MPLAALDASRRYDVGSKRSGVVGRGEFDIWRSWHAGSGARAKRKMGVTRMGQGLIQEATLSSTGLKELRRE